MRAVRYDMTRHDVTEGQFFSTFLQYYRAITMSINAWIETLVHTPDFEVNTVPLVFFVASFECCGYAHLYGMGWVYVSAITW